MKENTRLLLLARAWLALAALQVGFSSCGPETAGEERVQQRKPPVVSKPTAVSEIVHIPERARVNQQNLGYTLPKDVLWHLFGANGINIIPAWDLTNGTLTNTIVVVDDGFLPSSPAFSGCASKYLDISVGEKQPAEDFHGAAVVSLLSTCPGNSLGLVGVDNASPVIWLSTDQNTYVALAWVLGALDCAKWKCTKVLAKPPDVINMSFSNAGETVAAQQEIQVSFLILSQKARDKGTLLVASSGNTSKNADMEFPRSLSGVIAVGATNKEGKAADYSNWGHTIDVLAPGDRVPIVSERGAILAGGTSFASPVVAGVVSLMKSVYRELSWKTAIYFLQTTSVPMDCDAYCVGRADCIRDCCKGGVQVCTPGRVDAGAAVLAAKNAARDGLPKVALVDADEFAIALIPAGTGVKGKFTIRNVGGLNGRYLLTSDNPRITLMPAAVDLDEKGGAHDHEEITIASNMSHPGWVNIAIKSPEAGIIAGYTDEIVVSALRVEPK
ncbi:MAG TPA: S8 family serine peptidase [Myxococcota bacterium]|nr:S8 family serine peptidase [Myxococcota bacterium]